jgi:hypothetical protein
MLRSKTLKNILNGDGSADDKLVEISLSLDKVSQKTSKVLKFLRYVLEVLVPMALIAYYEIFIMR